ncbi:MAG: LysR family transcriptional regulator [Spirochaetales bacterium]|nr:LysR family transcriptional regulator [Spirochaetales bacterium]
MLHRYLEHFQAVAETSSVLRAAEKLHISQPALSRSLKILEEIMDVPLFIRRNKGVEITEYGKVLYKQVCSMGNEFRYALQEIDYIKNKDIRQLRVGSGLVWQYGVLPNAVLQYSKEFPDMQMKIITGYSQTLYEQFLEGHFDLIFCDIGSLKPSEGVVFEHLMNVFFSFFASWRHPVFAKESHSEMDLRLYDFAVFSHNNQIAEDAKDDHQISAAFRTRIKYISGSMINLLEVVSATEYITSLPQFIHTIAEQFGLKEIHPDMRRATFPSGVIYRKSALEKDYIRRYLEIVRESVQLGMEGPVLPAGDRTCGGYS